MFPELMRDDVFRIETRRLWLRWPRIQDAAAIQRMAGAPEVALMTATVPHPYPPGAAERFIFEARKGNATGAHLQFVVAPRRDPAQALGVIGAREVVDGVEIGYWLGQAHWRKGFATEAAQALIDAVFFYAEAGAVVAATRADNPDSRRVLEKCGFQYEGPAMCAAPARGGAIAADRFVLRRSTWASLKDWRRPELPAAKSDGQQQAEIAA